MRIARIAGLTPFFTYDAENKLIKLDGTTGYAYDGEGKRIRKFIGENTRFIYGIGGELVAEYNSSGTVQKEYVYGASVLIATIDSTNGAQYLTTDHLGSPRVATSSGGTVTSRRDFMPFGEEVSTGAGRSGGQGWPGTVARQKFTGYERDTESSLDFAQARYYSFGIGRFASIDPSGRSISSTSPQTWNRYTYCYNNPLRLVDKNGRWPTERHDEMIRSNFRGLSAEQIWLIQSGSRSVDRIGGGKPFATLWPSEAYKHAMTPSGMTEDTARQKAVDYLTERLKEMKALQKGWEKMGGTGLSGSALRVLGQATHVYEDMSSPVHGFDKQYEGPRVTAGTPMAGDSSLYSTAKVGENPSSLPSLGIGDWIDDQLDHRTAEDRPPTPEERALTATYSRAIFLLAFGDKAFERLEMKSDERMEARKLASQYRRTN